MFSRYGTCIGTTVKKIRQDKGILAKTVYSGIVTRSSYFRFENGETDTAADNLLSFLGRLQVSINEFVTLLFDQTYHYRRTIENVNLNIYQAMAGSSRAILKQEQARLSALHKETGLLVDYHNYLKLGMYAEYLEKKQLDKTAPHLTILVRYLFSIDNFYQYELALFVSICKLLPLETINVLLPRAMKTAQRLPIPSLRHVSPIEVLNNVILAAIDHQNYPFFKRFVSLSKTAVVSQNAIFAGMCRAVYLEFIAYCDEGRDLTHIMNAKNNVQLADRVLDQDLAALLNYTEQFLEEWLVKK